MHFPVDPGAPRHDVPDAGRSGFVLVDGRQVHYLEWGTSADPVVCCLHGGGQTAYMWEEMGSALRSRYHVLAPDLPGHGDSDPIEDMGRVELSATVEPFLAEFGVERAALVGASLGGIVSLTFAARHPEVVAAIALIDIGHRLEDEGVERIVDFMRRHESFASLEEAAAAVADFLPARTEVKPENLRRNLRERPDGRWEWKHVYGKRLRERGVQVTGDSWRTLVAGIAEEAAELTCPVLVLRGAQSDVLSDEGAQEIAALIPEGRLVTVGGAGHHTAGDAPTPTIGAVQAFLDQLPS